MIEIKTALISVYKKDGVLELAQKLQSHNVKIISSGGTASFLKENDIPVIEVSDYTGSPEMFDGRVKTLHPKIHAGILARGKTDEKQLSDIGADKIDLVVVNLYPFEEELNKNLNILTENNNGETSLNIAEKLANGGNGIQHTGGGGGGGGLLSNGGNGGSGIIILLLQNNGYIPEKEESVSEELNEKLLNNMKNNKKILGKNLSYLYNYNVKDNKELYHYIDKLYDEFIKEYNLDDKNCNNLTSHILIEKNILYNKNNTLN